MEIVRTRVYQRKARKLLSAVEMRAAEDEIIAAPDKWPVVSGTGGIRKARAARGSAGKSGGVRILHCFWLTEGAVYFLDINAKNDKGNLSDADKKLLKAILEGSKGSGHA